MTRADVFEIVKRHVLTVLPDVNPADVTDAARLVDLGASSFDRVEVVFNAQADLGLRVPAERFQSVADLGGLVDVLFDAVDRGTTT